MSIKDLFNKKVVVFKSAESASVDVESLDYMLNKAKEQQTFIPSIDFATASNFVKFGSAEQYYASSIERVYGNYPYDGSEAEKLSFALSSSYLDRWMFDNKYPKSTGYGILNPLGYTNSIKTEGYGLEASTSDYEYIFVGGGVHVADIKQDDPTYTDENQKLYKKFESGVFYEEGSDRNTVFGFSSLSGSTFEFWLKKDEFNSSHTEKEIIFDLWNGELSSSNDYGRITLELTASDDGLNPFLFTYQSGTVGTFQQSLASGSFVTSSVADGRWHHYAVSTLARLDGVTAYLDLKLYQDGIAVNEQSVTTTSVIGQLDGRVDGYIGALITSPSSSLGAATGKKYAGMLSASLDEFRFWKKQIDSREIYNNWFHPIGGGANTDQYRKHLGLYYKFNEGVVDSVTIDSNVMDYSGRVANGQWTGYSSLSRNTGSCFVSASVLAVEPADPIIRSSNVKITNLLTEMKSSGSLHDIQNPSYMFDMVPSWMREEDLANGDENLKKLYHILSTYFDTLYAQIEALPDLKAKKYFTMDQKPYPFVKELIEHSGLVVPQILVGESILEKFYDRDDNNIKFEHELDDLKSRIYYNIYNNLKTIYESKGTEKSYRNLLRCFGVDDEIIKLNLYTDNGISYLTDKAKYSSHKTKFLNSNAVAHYSGRVFNTSSVSNTKTFISGSGTNVVGESSFTRLGPAREKNLAFTMEADIIAPLKKTIDEDGYFPTDFLTSSIMGFHEANPDDASDFTWHGTDWANLQVHLVRREKESKDAKFVITNNQGNIFAESSFIKEIYDNERWGLALKVYPTGYPFIGTVATSSNPTYTAELYGVNQILNEVKQEFTIKATIDHTTGSAILSNAKRFYAGCEAENFTGSLTPNLNDIKIAACRLWYDKLDNAVVKQHNKDASNYGHNKIHGNPTPYIKGLENIHIPSADVLAFNWDFQLVTGSDSNGTFVVEDFSSGSSESRYGWIDELILRENRGKAMGYAANSTDVVVNEFIFSAKKELPEISFTSDMVFIKGQEEELFGEDEDTTDNVFAFEKSMYQVLSEEIFKTFTTVTEYANLFMKPVDRYREEYKRLDHFKELFFKRVDGDLDFEKFTTYYKFLDSTISTFIQQLHPAMSKFNEGISDMIESHILERPQYQRKFPFITTRDTVPDGKIVGIGEQLYNWRLGHAPVGTTSTTTTEQKNCLWQKERRVRTEQNGSKINELRDVIVSEVAGKAKNLGTSDRTIYQGPTYAVRSFSKQYNFSYDEQKTIHGGINYGHQKNRDYVLDHVRPHGPKSQAGVPQNVIVVGVGAGHGITGIDNCDDNSDPVLTEDYSRAHYLKAEYNFVGTVGRYADASGEQPKSSEVAIDHKVKGQRGFPFNIVSGTISTGYNAKIHSGYTQSAILTNLHSDTTHPTNEIPLQSPFTETWVGGRQFRHIPMNRQRTNPARSTATITLVAPPSNDETITISDGSTSKIFIFKSSPSGNLEVDSTGGTPGAVLTAIKSKIELVANNLQITCSVNNSTGVMTLTNTRSLAKQGFEGGTDVAIAETMADIRNVVSGFSGGNPSLDGPFTRPEGFRILVGDHASENIKDGALGIVGPDYGGPYPMTARRMAVHYRGDRIKRPLNIANIKTEPDDRQGNYSENYQVVSSVGRTENNIKFREFIDVSSSLPTKFNILPMTTHPVTLMGVAPFISGNVLGIGNSNNLVTEDRARREVVPGVYASGSFYVGAAVGPGLLASGSFALSGATVSSFSTGSFEVSASTTLGVSSEGFFNFVHPTYTVSTGSLTITGSTVFGTKATGQLTVGTYPYTMSFSSGSVTVTGSTVFAIKSSGSFTAAGRSTFGTQYTGSFQLQGPPLSATRSHMSFMAKGTTMADGDILKLTGSSVDKQIEMDTNGSVLGATDITLLSATPHFNYALYSDNANAVGTADCGIGTGNFSVSFWWYVVAGTLDSTQEYFMEIKDGTQVSIRIKCAGDAYDDLRMYVQNGSGAWWDLDANMVADTWKHIVLTYNRSTGEFLGYVNGSLGVDDQTGADVTALAGNSDDLDNFKIWWYEQGFQDLVFWDRVLSSGEASTIYNSGNAYNYTTCSFKSNIINWYKMGYDDYWRDIGYTLDDTLDTYGGSITRYQSSSYGDLNPITIAHQWGDDLKFTGSANAANPAVAYTNVQIWDTLKADLNTAFPLWTTTYISGSTEAQFFVIKDAVGTNTATQSEVGSSFTIKGSDTGQAAIASTLKHGDNITIEGDTFTIRTTTSGSSLPADKTVNAGNTFRKALHWPATATEKTYASNTSYTNPTNTNDYSISFWLRADNVGADGRYLIDITFDDDGSESHATFILLDDDDMKVYTYNADGGYKRHDYLAVLEANLWHHYTVVFDRTAVETAPVLYKNGSVEARDASAGSATGAGAPFEKVFIGNKDDTDAGWELQGSLQDFVIWNTDLDAEDANVLYNSGSYFDIHGHVSASHIWDWWEFGQESDFSGISSGSNVSPSDGVISPKVGRHDLTFQSETNVFVTDGIPSAWKTDANIFTELETLIENNTLYVPSEVTRANSGNTDTFTLTDSLASAPTAFSANAVQGFKSLTGPSANGPDLDNVIGGADDDAIIQIGFPPQAVVGRVKPDPDGDNSTTSAPYYANVGGDYHVYSGGSSDSDWWTRLAAACNAAWSGYTITHEGSGEFEITASAPGSAYNLTLAEAGDTFSSQVGVAGGRGDLGAGHQKGFKITVNGQNGYFYSFRSGSGYNSSYDFIQDGVWKKPSQSRYFVSSTGSNLKFWKDLTGSMKYFLNDRTTEEGTFNIYDLGDDSATLGFTGSFQTASTHDAAFLGGQTIDAHYGNNIYISDVDAAGYGRPVNTAYETSDRLVIEGATFEFTHPHDGYIQSTTGSIEVRVSSSKGEFVQALADRINNNTTFVAVRSGDNINLTAGITGSSKNAQITDTSQLFSITQTVGGDGEYGVGSRKGFKLKDIGNSEISRFYAIHDMGSSHNAGTVYVMDGVYRNGYTYYISSTGSVSASNGVDADWNRRVKESILHSFGTRYGESGSINIVSGSSFPGTALASYGFTGSLTASSNHNWSYAVENVGGGVPHNMLNTGNNSIGWGIPKDPSSGNPLYTSQTFQLSNGPGPAIIFELAFPYNTYSVVGTNKAIRATGSVASTFTAFSSSILAHSTASTILYQSTNGSTEKFTIRANPTGSLYNADFVSSSPFFSLTQNMSGGYDTFNALDDNWLFISHTGSDNYLFKIDNNSVEPTMKSNVTHTLNTSVASGVYNIAGETVTGSVIAATEVPSIVMVEGSIYKFMQENGNGHSGHSLKFTATSGSGTAFTTGVTSNGSPNNAGAYIQISCSSDTPKRLWYYCENDVGMGGAMYTMSASNQVYVDSTGTSTQFWDRLETAIETAIPRYKVSYSDAQAADLGVIGGVATDDYQPASKRVLFKITGSTNTGSLDDGVMLVSGPSWQPVTNITGAMQYAAGVKGMDTFTLNWGTDPKRSSLGDFTLNFGVVGLDGTSSYDGVANTDTATYVLLNRQSTGSYDSGGAWEHTSSLLWNDVTQSIVDTGQYTVSRTLSGNGKYSIFHVTGAYYGHRYNSGSVGSTAAVTEKTGLTSSGPVCNSFSIYTQITGGVRPAGYKHNDAYLEFINSLLGSTRIKVDIDGWRADDQVSRVIYLDGTKSTNTAFWNDISSSFNTHLTASGMAWPSNRLFDVSYTPTPSYSVKWGVSGESNLAYNYSNPNDKSYELIDGSGDDYSVIGAISFWIKSNTTADCTLLEAYRSVSDNHGGYDVYNSIELKTASSKLWVFLYDGDGDANSNYRRNAYSCPSGQWNQVTVTFDETDITVAPVVYVNGVSVSATNAYGSGTGDLIGFNGISIGDSTRVSSGVNELQGQLQDFVFWSSNYTNESAENIALLYNNGTRYNLINHPAFDTSAMMDWWTFGDEAGFANASVGDSFKDGGYPVQIQSITGNETTLSSNFSADAKSDAMSFEAGPPAGEAFFQITGSVTGSDKNFTYFNAAVSPTGSYTFFRSPVNVTGGVTYIPAWMYNEYLNIKPTEQKLLQNGTRQKTVITSRFSAPGGPEIQTESFLDVHAKEFSVYNAIPFRNLLVRNDSGEGFMEDRKLFPGRSGQPGRPSMPNDHGPVRRVNSHSRRREGLNTLHQRPAGRAGTDSYHAGAVNASDYDYEASFHKVHRNTLVVPRLSGSDSDVSAKQVEIVEKRNNFYLQSHLPASDYHYSWVTSSLGDNYSVRSGRQKVFGYWPKDGILVHGMTIDGTTGQVTSAKHSSAIIFPSASEIVGS